MVGESCNSAQVGEAPGKTPSQPPGAQDVKEEIVHGELDIDALVHGIHKGPDIVDASGANWHGEPRPPHARAVVCHDLFTVNGIVWGVARAELRKWLWRLLEQACRRHHERLPRGCRIARIQFYSAQYIARLTARCCARPMAHHSLTETPRPSLIRREPP